MDYNERAALIAQAVNPAYLPSDVLTAKLAQSPWDGDPVTDYREGDRVWHRPRMGRGWYALVLDGRNRPEYMNPTSVVIMPERDGPVAEVPVASLTLLRRA